MTFAIGEEAETGFGMHLGCLRGAVGSAVGLVKPLAGWHVVGKAVAAPPVWVVAEPGALEKREEVVERGLG